MFCSICSQGDSSHCTTPRTPLTEVHREALWLAPWAVKIQPKAPAKARQMHPLNTSCTHPQGHTNGKPGLVETQTWPRLDSCPEGAHSRGESMGWLPRNSINNPSSSFYIWDCSQPPTTPGTAWGALHLKRAIRSHGEHMRPQQGSPRPHRLLSNIQTRVFTWKNRSIHKSTQSDNSAMTRLHPALPMLEKGGAYLENNQIRIYLSVHL